ncbi:MlaD family protein [Reichenbachiella ulvae]|uniref:MlaD family protein n=1 Tax=Reichenbachiella ulvae TaxID=2980104 RepID=A0ABT3CNS0_9BACT|nr:MlaD family protein [Reichenbachiella ulvae]MCV9385174.1 MlaD family protein [Reichenbachiella ulvae]
MTKEIKVGLFAAISGAILYLGFNFLKGNNFFSDTQQFYAIYDNIDGLNVSNPVIVNGYAVGRVSNIEILQNQNNKIIVEMDVKGSLKVGKGTSAILMNSDFLGSKSILLEIKNHDTPLNSGDTINGEIDLGLAAILNRAEPLTDDIGVTISRLNEILLGMEGAGEELKQTLSNINTAVISVNKLVVQNNSRLEKSFNNINGLLVNINQKVDMLEPVLTGADSTLSKINSLELENTIANLNQVMMELDTTITAINESQGSLGKIINEDTLYNNLNQALTDLDKLLIHIDQNPKHFFGPLGQSSKKIAKDREKAARE